MSNEKRSEPVSSLTLQAETLLSAEIVDRKIAEYMRKIAGYFHERAMPPVEFLPPELAEE